MIRKTTHTHTPNRTMQAILALALAISFASAAQSQQILSFPTPHASTAQKLGPAASATR
jgi:hypothetical protein